MEHSSNTFVVARTLAWLAIAASILAPYLILHFGGANAGTVGYEGSDHLLAMVGVTAAAILLLRRESALMRTLALWGAALICLTLSGFSSISAFETVGVEREIAAARPMIDRLRGVIRDENVRLSTGSTDAPSPDVEALLERTPPYAPELSDTRRPLRERLQELTRRQGLATVRLQREFMRRLLEASDAGALNYENLVDAEHRKANLARIASRRETMDWWYGQIQTLSAQHEAHIMQLGMPQRSSVEMLRGARRAQDYAYPKLKAIVDGNKAILAAVEEAIGFAGTHVKTMHRSDGAIVFDDPNDTAAFNAIVQRAN